ncbi:MAG: hypothetical protein A2Y34_09050 [Spirochaetes bacterium GWC1_27_15]|nr:MAG: hypothetical protein A2Y34_09050 [Spirochaetes bacterium GWC1_27_15]
MLICYNLPILAWRVKNLCYIFLFIPFLVFSNEKVRVNIVGYPKLDNFSIKLNNNSILYINQQKIVTDKIEIFCKEKKVVFTKNKSLFFENITIISNGIVVFDCFLGEQDYEGNFYITPKEDKISIINEIDIDKYFASVLGSEMGGGFSFEALKASAIAIRTYYYNKKNHYKNSDFDINNADGIDMVYRGNSFATKKMFKAFDDTKNLYLVNSNNELALPLFHSTSGGIILKDQVMMSKFNENIENPVLLYDIDEKKNPLSQKSPYFKFEINFTEDSLKKIVSSKLVLKRIQSIKLKYFRNTKCVDFIGFVENSENIRWLKAYEFVSLAQKNGFYNLRSIQFTMDKINNTFYFKGQGFGHLCGLSQYSAETLAKKGANYVEILNKYYPDFSIKEINYIF